MRVIHLRKGIPRPQNMFFGCIKTLSNGILHIDTCVFGAQNCDIGIQLPSWVQPLHSIQVISLTEVNHGWKCNLKNVFIYPSYYLQQFELQLWLTSINVSAYCNCSFSSWDSMPPFARAATAPARCMLVFSGCFVKLLHISLLDEIRAVSTANLLLLWMMGRIYWQKLITIMALQHLQRTLLIKHLLEQNHLRKWICNSGVFPTLS